MENNQLQISENKQLSKEQSVTPMAMIQQAIEKGSDLSVVEKLMDLQERWEKNEARKAFVHAMNEFKKNMPNINKNKKGFNFEYASLDNVNDIITKSLNQYGLSTRWQTETTDNKIKVTCILTHEMGHSESTWLAADPDKTGSKNDVQGLGSTVTYLQRYTLLSITGIAVKGMDNDGNNQIDTISEKQLSELIALIQKSKADGKKFLDAFKISDLKNLPAEKFEYAKKLLNNKLQAGKK